MAFFFCSNRIFGAYLRAEEGRRVREEEGELTLPLTAH